MSMTTENLRKALGVRMIRDYDPYWVEPAPLPDWVRMGHMTRLLYIALFVTVIILLLRALTE